MYLKTLQKEGVEVFRVLEKTLHIFLRKTLRHLLRRIPGLGQNSTSKIRDNGSNSLLNLLLNDEI